MSLIETEDHIIRSPRTVDYPDISFAEFLTRQLDKIDHNLVALIDPNNEATTLTYGQLIQQAHQFANGLLGLGVTKQDFVMFYAENSFHYVTAILGTVFLGLNFCPIPPTSGPYELTEQIKQSNGTVLVFGSDKVSTIEKSLNESDYVEAMKRLKIMIQLECDEPDSNVLEHSVVVGKEVCSFGKILENGSEQKLTRIPHFPITDPSKEHFLICFTSGTTGAPKGAIHSHRSFLTGLINIIHPSVVPGNPAVIWHPMGHISGTFVVLHALATGQSVVLFANSNLDQLFQAVAKYKVKHFTISAEHAAQLVNVDYKAKYNLDSLFVLSHVGCHIADNILHTIREKYKVILLDTYGSTEMLGAIGERGDFSSLFGDNFKPGNLGTCLPNVELKVIDLQSGVALPANESGEICLRGVQCFIGYLNNEKATKQTIDENGWYHTGDIGYYDENGNLFITDRIKELIKYKHYSVIPAEIEDFLHRYKGVQAVCVVGVPHSTDGNLIRAYVQLVPGKSVTEQELIDYVAENMGSQKRLRAGVRFVDQIPRTLVGKVDRQYFKRLIKDELLTEPVSD